jgi:predicted DNA-binding antitoxin AbrB/MazE fold protein
VRTVTTEPEHQITKVRLDDGERVDLSVRDAERVFEQLWSIAPQTKGAVSAAAKLKRVESWTFLHGDDVLTKEETSAFREALRRALPG